MLNEESELILLGIVALACAATDGLAVRKLASALAINHFRARKLTHEASRRGLIAVTGSGVSARWASPARAAELNVARWTYRRLQIAAARRRRLARVADALDAADLNPRRKAKPFVVQALNSVFATEPVVLRVSA